MFVGSEGILVCGAAGGDYQIYPQSRSEAIEVPQPSIARSGGHHRDWIDAIKGGPPASSSFEYGAKLTEIVLLGLVALRTGEVIRWDSDAMTATGVSSADEIIRESYRPGWEVEA